MYRSEGRGSGAGPGFYLRYLLRDSRGARGRLAVFALCLAVGVAAVVAVAALADGLERALRREAKQLLGGDVAVEGTRPIPPEVSAAAASAGVTARVAVRELATMAATPAVAGELPRSQLVELKVVEGPYPLYGEALLESGEPVAAALERGAVVAPDLLERLGLGRGGAVALGEATLPIAGVLASEPDRAVTPFTLGPRVLLSAEHFARTHLETFGSRIRYQLAWRLPGNPGPAEAGAFADSLRAALAGSPWWQVETYHQAQPGLQQGLQRVERYLGLVALLSLLVGGVGVAQSIRSFLASRLDAVAVLKCLGVRPRQALGLYLAQVVLLAAVGSLLGGLAGLLLQLQLPRLLGDLVPAHALTFWQPAALARGVALGLAVALLFALPPLTAVVRVPPLRALRRDVDPPPPRRIVRWLLAAGVVAGVLLLAAAQSGSFVLGARFTGGLVAAVAVLAATARLLRAAAARLRHLPVPVAVRQGAASLARPGSDTLAAAVALGLGVLVVLTTLLIERHLTASLRAELPANAPTAFLLDIQPDQWPGVAALLAEAGAGNVDSVPVVMARLTAVDGRPVAELAGAAPADDERQWALTREQRLTYLEQLPPDNRLVAGALWQDPAVAEVSLEEDYARDLGVGLGSTLGFDVQGVPVELTVTSLRAVDWRSFRINFFLVVEPAALAEAPQTRLAAAALPAGAEGVVRGLLARDFPNVTLVDIRDLLEKVARLFHRLGTAVRFLGGFTAAAGAAILFGAVAGAAVRRGREVALLKTLGFTRRGVTAVFATEHALVGAVGGLVGAAGAALLTVLVVRRGFDLEWHPYPGLLAAGVAAAVGLAVTAGLTASLRALRRPPVEVLRDERE
ncbi:MAG TPA: FtsX-like permease family protein [Thermoanaerobaculia bacterium]|nr:FtsX-like permease family protein [Thermoanaerobaculia bacterium]